MILSGVVIFFTLLMLPIRYDAPNVVDCLDAPIMHVEVTPGEDRRGNIVERHAMGCTWYWYEGVGGD